MVLSESKEKEKKNSAPVEAIRKRDRLFGMITPL